MARPLRLDLPDLWHHVMNRGSDRQDIFGQDLDFEKFEYLLQMAATSTGIHIHAYCLMRNHFHLLVHCPDGGLSEAMRSVQRQYTQWYNTHYERDGPLYRGRFHSVGVTTDEQLTTVGRYIHRNPLAFVPAGALSTYRWSSFGVYAGRRPAPSWLTTERLAAAFPDDPSGYRRFVEVDLPSDDLVRQGDVTRPVTIDDIVRSVSNITGVTERAIREPSRGNPNASRLMAITLAIELRVGPTGQLASYFAVGSAASLRTLGRRGRVAIASQPAAASLRRRVLNDLYRAELLRGA